MHGQKAGLCVTCVVFDSSLSGDGTRRSGFRKRGDDDVLLANGQGRSPLSSRLETRGLLGSPRHFGPQWGATVHLPKLVDLQLFPPGRRRELQVATYAHLAAKRAGIAITMSSLLSPTFSDCNVVLSCNIVALIGLIPKNIIKF